MPPLPSASAPQPVPVPPVSPVAAVALAVPPPPARLLAIVLSQFLFALLAMTICLPSMQEWSALFGVPQSTVQLTFSAYVVAFGVLQLLYGPLSDRLGRRPVLVLGLLVAVLASFAAALAPTAPWLVAARLLQGAGAAACMVVGRALVQDHFQGAERTRVMAYVGMAMGLGPPTATVLGGQLHVHLGWQSNFIFMGVMGLLVALATWRGLPAGGVGAGVGEGTGVTTVLPARQQLAQMGHAYGLLAHQPAFVLMVLLLGFTTAAFYAFLAGAPVVLLGYGVGPDRIGFVIMCVPLSYIVGNFLTSRLAHRQGAAGLLRLGQIFTLGGLLLLTLLALAGLRSVWALVLPLMLLGLGHGLLVPSTLATSVGVLPALAGAAAAVAGVMQQGLGALGGYVVGLVPHQAGVLNLALLMLGFSLLGAAAHAGWLRQQTHAGAHPRKTP